MVVCVFVDLAEGCTGAAGQVSHWVMRARSFASGSFPQPRGPPQWDLLVKLHMCIRTPNPSESTIYVRLYVVAVVIASNKLWQTYNITERKRAVKNDSCFLSLTLSNMLALMAKEPENVFLCEGQKIVLSLFGRAEGVTDGRRITGAAEDKTRIKNSQLCE